MDRDDASAGEQPTDDLTEITRLGRETARRLRDAGVRTFADLASHSPSELATKGRVAQQRVEREDWIGQARARVERSSPAGAEAPVAVDDDAEHGVSFVVKLTVDDDNKVIRTAVTHATSSQEAPPWAGWDIGRLVEFMSGYVDLGERAGRGSAGAPAAPADKPGAAGPAVVVPPKPEPASPAVLARPEPPPGPPTPPPPGEVRLGELEVVAVASGAPQRSFDAGEPFAVRLGFVVEGGEAARPAALEYTVTVTARTLGERRRRTETVGELNGALAGTGGADVEVQSSGLPPGTYRLDGTLRLREPGAARPHRLLPLQGGLFEVTEPTA